jgi:hypothetical protein
VNVAGFVLVLVLGNVMSNPTMPPAEVRHDIRALFRLDGEATCGNEIEPPGYKRAWRAIAGRSGARTYGAASPNPVALRGRARAVSVRRLSAGVAHLTPERYAVVVKRPRVAIVCTHLINRAWTSNDGSTALRRRIWHREVRGLRAIVRRQLAAGRTVAVLGDLNTPNRVTWRRRQVSLGNLYRMQAAVIPAPGWTARRIPGGRTIDAGRLFTDHPFMRRVVRLRRANPE